jgi:hypothetical protein
MQPAMGIDDAAEPAHARIDAWDEALPWVLETLHGAKR